MRQDGDPDRKGDGQDDVVPGGGQIEADIEKGDLHREQDAEDSEGLPLAGTEAQVRLGEQCPAQHHDPADNEPHRAQAQGRGVVETDLGRDRQTTPQDSEHERKEGCRDGERTMLRRSGASRDQGPPRGRSHDRRLYRLALRGKGGDGLTGAGQRLGRAAVGARHDVPLHHPAEQGEAPHKGRFLRRGAIHRALPPVIAA